MAWSAGWRNSIRTWPVLLVAVLVAGCGGSLSSGGPNDTPTVSIASIRIFDAANTDLTDHLPFPAGRATRIRFRFYAPDGKEVTSLPGAADLALAFTPSNFASAATVPGEALSRDVSPTTPPGTPGAMNVTVSIPAAGLLRTFGPFDALIH